MIDEAQRRFEREEDELGHLLSKLRTGEILKEGHVVWCKSRRGKTRFHAWLPGVFLGRSKTDEGWSDDGGSSVCGKVSKQFGSDLLQFRAAVARREANDRDTKRLEKELGGNLIEVIWAPALFRCKTCAGRVKVAEDSGEELELVREGLVRLAHLAGVANGAIL